MNIAFNLAEASCNSFGFRQADAAYKMALCLQHETSYTQSKKHAVFVFHDKSCLIISNREVCVIAGDELVKFQKKAASLPRPNGAELPLRLSLYAGKWIESELVVYDNCPRVLVTKDSIWI